MKAYTPPPLLTDAPPTAPDASVDTITVLRSIYDDYPLAKTITPDGESRVKQDAMWYSAEEFPIHDVHSLAAVLEEASRDPYKCVVRGQIIETADRTRMLRRKLERDDGTKPTLREVPHSWLLLDIDSVETPPEFDQFASPAATVAFVKELLPTAFHSATCWFQHTGSAGTKPGIRLRLGFWLDRALENTELKRWLGQCKIDLALFSAAQIHYVAAPILARGAADPLGGRPRSGIIPGEADAVAVPPSPEPELHIVDPGTESRPQAGEPPSADTPRLPRSLRLSSLASFKDHLAAIGDHHDRGLGCHGVLKAAISAYWREWGADASADALQALLEKRINQAVWDPARGHTPEYLQKQIKDLPGFINQIKRLQRKTEAENSFEVIGIDRVEAKQDEAKDEVRSPQHSDDALALRFAAAHANSLRYVAKLGRWLTWDGTRWSFDEMLLARKHARNVCRRAALECNKPKEGKLIASAKTISAVERLAQADPLIAATVDQWDFDPWLLNTPAGTINLRTGERKAHDPTDYLTKITGVAPDDSCSTRTWQEFLTRVTGGNQELIDFLQRMAGYSLTGSTREHAMFFKFGKGANGKTTYMNAIIGAVGEYHSTAPIEAFTATNQDRHPTDLAGLRGARLVTAVETEEGRRWAESKIKALTGGDKISARFMRQDFFEYVPQFKLVIAGNHKPGLRSVDEAMKRRLNLIPFTVTIPPGERDEQLPDKLKAELPGILAWMIKGCASWIERGLAPPPIVTDATAEYLAAEDAVSVWMEDAGLREPNAWETSNKLWTAWSSWADAAGEFVGTQKRFREQIEARGLQKADQRMARGYRGFRLFPAEQV
jgi:putative DNA primase/helicase